MKTRNYLFILFFIILTTSAYAQRSIEITGTVIEKSTNEPIEQATVRLLGEKDSSMIGGVATSRNGYFTLKNIKKGNYLLHISFVGYEPLFQPLRITGKTNTIKLGKLYLNDGSIQLGEAVIVGKAPEITVNNDTIIYNADSYKVSEGSMLEDLLKKVKLKKTASLEFNNLSKKLKDEDVVIIYSDEEITNFQNGNTAIKYIEKECICPSISNISCFDNAITNLDGIINQSGKVSLNSATIEELMTLPGIGEGRAKLIIEYRNQNNGFKNIEEIMNIKGVGEKVFEKLKAYLTL
jgi:competence ComEA-like helix-hairpin-helix protein